MVYNNRNNNNNSDYNISTVFKYGMKKISVFGTDRSRVSNNNLYPLLRTRTADDKINYYV